MNICVFLVLSVLFISCKVNNTGQIKKKYKTLSCYNFKDHSSHKGIILNIGLRVNNFIFFDINLRPQDSKRKLYYKPYFDVTEKYTKIKFFYKMKQSDNTFVNYPKEHLLVFFKTRGHIEGDKGNFHDNAYKDMVGRAPNISKNASHISYLPTILFELLAIGTNHNFSSKFPYGTKEAWFPFLHHK